MLSCKDASTLHENTNHPFGKHKKQKIRHFEILSSSRWF